MFSLYQPKGILEANSAICLKPYLHALEEVMDKRVDTDEDWMQDGACRPPTINPKMFFPGNDPGLKAAQAIFNTCPVKARCLEYALANRIDHGVWGGESERSRRRILKARAKRLLQQKSPAYRPDAST